MKRQIFKVVSVVTLALLVSFSSAELVVYEGFDYTAGTVIDTQGTAVDGWAGAWATSGGSNPAKVAAGETFGSLEVSGGAWQRPSKTGNAASMRTITDDAKTSLTADNSTMWFSVLMNVGENASPFAANSFATLVLGDAALTGGSGSTAAPIGTGGNAIGVAFGGTGWASATHVDAGSIDLVRIMGVTYSGGTLTQSGTTVNGTTATETIPDGTVTVGTATAMIVGKVDWAANGTDDVLSLYNVTNPAGALPTAFATMEVDLDQTAFNVISIGDAQTAIFDEIRMGTPYADVAPGPEPAPGRLVVLGGVGLLRRRRT